MSDPIQRIADSSSVEAIPASALRLVERFAEHADVYRRGDYNETLLRRDFLDPFFEALGWDVANRASEPEAFREVVHEDRVKVGASTKAPDYAFRVGGVRKFFVEAKKPAVDVQGDIAPAYQLRRYAWSAKLPLSIVTDFEELAVYDCRVKPEPKDGAAIARAMYFHYSEFAARWSELASIFGKEAIRGGAFDRYAESMKVKRGTAEVDDAFLADLEAWRDVLARNIALRNAPLSVRALNEAVQQTLDRIIFLRICEDRGIEPYGRLLGLTNGAGVYGRLGEVFQQADARFNSGLFHFGAEKGRGGEPDAWTLRLAIDDKVLRDIVRRLYYPDSPYEFSVIPADLLGHVYERFLGKVIRLTAGGRAVVEEKPAVRKAGGVFYTPTYVVDHIVRHTVGRLLEGRTPKTAADLKIADPACGSGSFLIGAYQHLLDWHAAWYIANDPRRHKHALRETEGGWRLTTAERKRILTSCIFGVDIDPQAVEVTKLSLLLKVLEGETDETLGGQLRLMQERALPDLGRNIQCGNSLIGSDAYAGQQLALMPDDDVARINAFDWDRAFPEVMARGGFDAVIGNPPYVRIQAMKEWAPLEVELYKKRYRAASKGNYDIYVVFVEKGLGLLRDGGRLGYILPHKFFNAQYGQPLRAVLAEGRHLSEVVHFGDQQVFADATTYTCLMFLDKSGAPAVRFTKVDDLAAWRATAAAASLGALSSEDVAATTGDIAAEKVTGAEWNFVVSRGAGLFERLREMPVKLGDVASRIYQGPITSADTVFLFKEYRLTDNGTVECYSKELKEWIEFERDILKRVVRSGSIGRYAAAEAAKVIFPYQVSNNSATLRSRVEMEARFPLAWAYLMRNRKLLESREKSSFRGMDWYRFGRTQNLAMWERPKIMLPYMISTLSAYFDSDDHYYFINVTTGGYGLTIDEGQGNYDFLCGILNSRLLDFALKRISTTFHGGYFAANKQFVEQLPIRPIDPTSPSDVALHDHLVALVQRILDLHKRMAELKSAHDKTVVGRQIEATDREIDRLVYGLYGLTEAEVAVVEGR